MKHPIPRTTRIAAAFCAAFSITLGAFAADPDTATPTASPSPAASPSGAKGNLNITWPAGVDANAGSRPRTNNELDPRHYNPFNPTYQFIFFATLEGLYRDGVSDADVSSLLATGGPDSGYLNFIYTCPICMPVEAAIVTYKQRPRIDHLKMPSYYTTERTFGSGLPPEVSQDLASKKSSIRLKALNALVSKWIAYRMDHSGLTDDEKKNLVDSMKKGREEGMRALRGFAKGSNGPNSLKAFAPGYQDGDECALCNAALQMPLKLKQP